MNKPVIRCSSLGRILGCHGSLTLVPMIAPRDGGESWEGSMLHWLVAKDLVDLLGAEAPDGLPAWPKGVPVTYQLPRQSEWLRNTWLVHAKESIPDDWALQVENELRWEFDRFILVGHHDVLGLDGRLKRSHGIDWKSVYNAVPPAAQNNQVLGYLALEHLNYDTNESSFDVSQPRIGHEEGEKLSTVKLDRAGLERSVSFLNDEVNRALDNAMETNSGPSQCAWCPVGIQCPSIQKEIEYMKATLTPELLAAIRAQPNDQLLADVVVSARILRKPIEGAEELIRERLAEVGRLNASSGPTLTMEIRRGKFSVREGSEEKVLDKMLELLPKSDLSHVVSYSTDEFKHRLAKIRNIPQGGKQPVTAEKIFNEQIAPEMVQGESRVIKIA